MSVSPTSTKPNTTPTGQGPLPRAIEMLRSRFEDSSVCASLKGFTRTFQVSLSDLKEDYVFTVQDGRLVGLERKGIPNPNIAMVVASSLMEGILNKSANGILAFLTGRLKMKGTRNDLMRLQKIMG